MNPKAQRIAIAEACGWKRGKKKHPKPFKSGDGWISPQNVFHDYLPDYLNDLNAMHQVEMGELTWTQRACVRMLLKDYFTPDRDRDTTADQYEATLCHATAAQRAEAFLRTIGKWVDDK